MLRQGGKRNLQATRLSPTYRRALARAWLVFAEFCARVGASDPVSLGEQPKVLERLLIEFCQVQYEANSRYGFTCAKYALLAAQTIHRGLRGSLRLAWDSIDSWGQERQVSLRKPLPYLVCQALTGVARLLAWEACYRDPGLSCEWLLVSVLIESGFLALLRPGEPLSLTGAQICCDDGDGHGWASLALLKPKNRRYMGRIQYAAVRSRDAS